MELVECYNNTTNIHINYHLSANFPHQTDGGDLVEFHQNGPSVPLRRIGVSQKWDKMSHFALETGLARPVLYSRCRMLYNILWGLVEVFVRSWLYKVPS